MVLDKFLGPSELHFFSSYIQTRVKKTLSLQVVVTIHERKQAKGPVWYSVNTLELAAGH